MQEAEAPKPKRIITFESEVERLPSREARDFAAYVNLPVTMDTYLFLLSINPDIKASATLEDLIDWYITMCAGGPNEMPDAWHEFRLVTEEMQDLQKQRETE